MSTFLDALFHQAGPSVDASHILITTGSPVTLEAGANYVISGATPASVTLPDAVAVAGRRVRVTFSKDNATVTLSGGNSFLLDHGVSTSGPLSALVAGTYVFQAFADPTVYPGGYWIVQTPSDQQLAIYPLDDLIDGMTEDRSKIYVGKVNLLDTMTGAGGGEGDGPPTLTLQLTVAAPPYAAHIGDRFAIKVTDAISSRPTQILLLGGQEIEAPLDATLSGSLTFDARPGTYLEWALDGSDTWRLVGYLRGYMGA